MEKIISDSEIMPNDEPVEENQILDDLPDSDPVEENQIEDDQPCSDKVEGNQIEDDQPMSSCKRICFCFELAIGFAIEP